MNLKIVPFEEKYLSDAAKLVSERYQAQLKAIPLLPSQYGQADTIAGLLKNIAGKYFGAAALENGKLVGFIAPWLLGNFHGQRSIYSPEWANGAELGNSRRIYQAIYGYLAGEWHADQTYTHILSLLPVDTEALAGLNWLGFGVYGADAIRSLEAVEAAPHPYTIRLGTAEDAQHLKTLKHALQDHITSSPIFLTNDEDYPLDECRSLLENPEKAFFFAFNGEKPAAFLEFGPASQNACTIIRDPGTTSITGAYAVPEARGQGTAAALLNAGLAWARQREYTRCCVDFESSNILGSRFWLKHFEPVHLAVMRRVHEAVDRSFSP